MPTPSRSSQECKIVVCSIVNDSRYCTAVQRYQEIVKSLAPAYLCRMQELSESFRQLHQAISSVQAMCLGGPNANTA